MSGNTCRCGKPIQDTGNLCGDCGGAITRNLYKIADRWAELEDALTWREVIESESAKPKNGMVAVGGTPNEAAMRARRAASDVVWFTVQVLREDFDRFGWVFAPPRTERTQDGTPALARWVASRHVKHLTHKADPETAWEIAGDLTRAEALTFAAINPSRVQWVPVNARCTQDAPDEDEDGTRIPCPGWMWAKVGLDLMPDLVCDIGTGKPPVTPHPEGTHTVAPQVWEREGWKRRHREGMDPAGVARLVEKLRA